MFHVSGESHKCFCYVFPCAGCYTGVPEPIWRPSRTNRTMRVQELTDGQASDMNTLQIRMAAIHSSWNIGTSNKPVNQLGLAWILAVDHKPMCQFYTIWPESYRAYTRSAIPELNLHGSAPAFWRQSQQSDFGLEAARRSDRDTTSMPTCPSKVVGEGIQKHVILKIQ